MKDIQLHPTSLFYLKEVFEPYQELEGNHKLVTVNSPIIHLYAESDTYDENGELHGFADALFFNADVYDRDNFVKYKATGHYDAVFSESPYQTRIFKDGSTMLMFRGLHEIRYGQVLDITKVGE